MVVHVLSQRMVDRHIGTTCETIVSGVLVSDHLGPRQCETVQELPQRHSVNRSNYLDPDPPRVLIPHSHNWSLANSASAGMELPISMLVSLQPADVGLIALHRVRKYRLGLLKSLADGWST